MIFDATIKDVEITQNHDVDRYRKSHKQKRGNARSWCGNDVETTIKDSEVTLFRHHNRMFPRRRVSTSHQYFHYDYNLVTLISISPYTKSGSTHTYTRKVNNVFVLYCLYSWTIANLESRVARQFSRKIINFYIKFYCMRMFWFK